MREVEKKIPIIVDPDYENITNSDDYYSVKMGCGNCHSPRPFSNRTTVEVLILKGTKVPVGPLVCPNCETASLK
jgi:hypothetical protein